MKSLVKILTSSIVGFTLVGTAFQARPSLAQTNSARSIAEQAHLLQGIEIETSELDLILGEDDVSAIDENIEANYQLSLSENDVRIIERDRQTWAPRPFWGNKGDGIDYSILVDVYGF